MFIGVQAGQTQKPKDEMSDSTLTSGFKATTTRCRVSVFYAAGAAVCTQLIAK